MRTITLDIPDESDRDPGRTERCDEAVAIHVFPNPRARSTTSVVAIYLRVVRG